MKINFWAQLPDIPVYPNGLILDWFEIFSYISVIPWQFPFALPKCESHITHEWLVPLNLPHGIVTHWYMKITLVMITVIIMMKTMATMMTNTMTMTSTTFHQCWFHWEIYIILYRSIITLLGFHDRAFNDGGSCNGNRIRNLHTSVTKLTAMPVLGRNRWDAGSIGSFRSSSDTSHRWLSARLQQLHC